MIEEDTMRRSSLLLLALGLIACGDDLPDDYMNSNGDLGAQESTTTGPSTLSTSGVSTTSPSAMTTSSSSSSSTGEGNTFGELDECARTSDCGADLFCVAPFDESLGPQGKGLNECVTQCVEIMDETRWCLDAAACCDPDAMCTDRGYCVFPDQTTGEPTDTGETSGTGTSTGD